MMASYGYRVVNIETYNDTNGLTLTLLLIFGLLLTPFCIGVVILCFLPFAFSKRYNVSYIFQPPQALPPSAPTYSQPLAPPMYGQPVYRPSPYSQPLMPPAGPPSYAPAMSQSGTLGQPPQQQASQTSLNARFREGLGDLAQMWSRWTPVQRALTIAATVAVIGIAVVVAAYAVYLLALTSGSGLPA